MIISKQETGEVFDALRLRQFVLNLSMSDGQELSKILGYSSPSRDVSLLEDNDVLASWVQLAFAGVTDSVVEAVQWFSVLMKKANPAVDEPSVEYMQVLLNSFTVATILKLLNEGLIHLQKDVEVSVIRVEGETI